jgi:hypothetical protein
VEAKSVREGGDAAEAPAGRAAESVTLPVLDAAELAALDAEEPAARTRRAFIGVSFAAGVVCLMPQQWVSGALCLAVSLGLYVWHRRRSAAEASAAQSTRENASSA